MTELRGRKAKAWVPQKAATCPHPAAPQVPPSCSDLVHPEPDQSSLRPSWRKQLNDVLIYKLL